MSRESNSPPTSCNKILELYFLENRAKLLDIAAFLDRADRARTDADREDFRLDAFRRALFILQENAPGRARRIQELFSDPTTEPIASAEGMKGASGVHDDFRGADETR